MPKINLSQIINSNISIENLDAQIDFINAKMHEIMAELIDKTEGDNTQIRREREFYKEYINFLLITRMKLSLIKIKKEIQEQKQKVKEYNN